MSRLFYHTMQDNAGNLLFGVSGTMRLAGTGTVATIYGDEALTVVLPNPMTNHPSFGSFKCFLPVGDFDFYMAKSGYTFETLTGVQGYGSMAQQEANNVAITGGTATLSGLLTASAGITTNNITSSTGTFNGLITANAGVTANNLNSATGTFSGLLTANAGVATNNLNSATGTFSGLLTASGGVTTNNLATATSTMSGLLTANGGITTSNIDATSARKPGNGPWADTSYRHLKTNVQPIASAVALALLLAQRGYVYEWVEPAHKAKLPGPQYGLMQDEVTIPQWIDRQADGTELLCPRTDALMIEALRAIVQRLEALEARLEG